MVVWVPVGRMVPMTDSEDLAHNRELWDVVNDQFAGADGLTLWRSPAIVWGLFATPESEVAALCAVVHDAGGQVYVDGANLNALVGLAKPGKTPGCLHAAVVFA